MIPEGVDMMGERQKRGEPAGSGEEGRREPSGEGGWHSPRTAGCGSPCPPWGTACYYCGEREVRGQA